MFGRLRARQPLAASSGGAWHELVPVPPADPVIDWRLWLEEQEPSCPREPTRSGAAHALPLELACQHESVDERSPRRRAWPPVGKLWCDILLGLDKHLTDEEIRVIRRQMAFEMEVAAPR